MKLEKMLTAALKVDREHLLVKIKEYDKHIFELQSCDEEEEEVNESIVDYQQGKMDCEHLLEKINLILKERGEL